MLGGEARVFPHLGFPSTATFRHFRSYYLIFTSDRESAKDQKNTRSLFIKKKKQKKPKKNKREMRNLRMVEWKLTRSFSSCNKCGLKFKGVPVLPLLNISFLVFGYFSLG